MYSRPPNVIKLSIHLYSILCGEWTKHNYSKITNIDQLNSNSCTCDGSNADYICRWKIRRKTQFRMDALERADIIHIQFDLTAYKKKSHKQRIHSLTMQTTNSVDSQNFVILWRCDAIFNAFHSQSRTTEQNEHKRNRWKGKKKKQHTNVLHNQMPPHTYHPGNRITKYITI